MLKLSLKIILKLKDVHSPIPFFAKKGYSATYTRKLMREEVDSITFRRLEELCLVFNCTPNDLFKYVPNAAKPLPEGHALQQLVRDDAIVEINKLLHDLPLEKIRQLYAIMKEEKQGGETA